jgi:hypothetical protein
MASTSGRRERGPVRRARRRWAAMSRPGRIVTAVVAAVLGLGVAFAVLGAILAACGYEAKGPQAPPPSSASSTVPSTSAPVRTETATGAPPPSHPLPSPPAPTVTATETTETSEAPPTTFVYYKDCDAARAAGAAPLHRGDPGYRSGLDRDGDGVACEPYNG